MDKITFTSMLLIVVMCLVGAPEKANSQTNISQNYNHSSISTSNGKVHASASLGKNSKSVIQLNRDKIELKVKNFDLSPLSYDGDGSVTMLISINGRSYLHKYIVPASQNLISNEAIELYEIKGFYINLVEFSGNAQNPTFSFEVYPK